MAKVVIRRGVYETNSSSSHSMCISNKEGTCIDTETILNLLNVHGVWKLKDLYYGRSPLRILDTFSEKVLYYIAATQGKEIDKVSEIVKKYVPEFTKFEPDDDDWSPWGYVENTSFFGWIRDNHIDLEDLLTKKKYFIVTDGDEYNVFTGLVDAGMISKDVNVDTSWDG